MLSNTILLFLNAMGEVLDLPHLYRHVGISLTMWLVMIAFVVVDLIDGVHTAKVLKKKIHSHKLRLTVIKFGEYWRFLLFGFFFDFIGIVFPWYSYPYMTIVITIGLAIIELKSMLEHAKKRKSKTAELPNIVSQIVGCDSAEEAKKLIKNIVQTYEDKKE
ncbi:MAG: phage holin family protein [Muribaculaceae bacterium]|nr:phage holin family protein [Muribaculaceae bacterium]